MSTPSRLRPGGPPAPKGHTVGTHRRVPPHETLTRVRPHHRALGITRVADVTGLDRIGIPVVMVTRPNSRSLAVSQGKGPTLAAAEASGVMEAAETHLAERPRLPLRLGSERELRAHTAVVDTALLPMAPDGGYAPDLPLLWATGIDLLGGGPVAVPYELVHTHYTTAPLPGAGSFVASSNGLASGNHPMEALAHALYEVIERDATALWELRPPADQVATRIDLGTVTDPICREMLDRFAAADVLVAVWEQTSDVGIAVFCCEIADADGAAPGPTAAAAGMGAHHDRGIALLRALTEAAQSRLTTIAGSRDDQPRPAYDASHDPETLAAHRADLADTSGARRPFDAAPHAVHDCFDDDVADLCTRLTGAGIEQVVAFDLSVPEIPVDVVRVVVPGLEHPAFGAAELVAGPRARKVAGV